MKKIVLFLLCSLIVPSMALAAVSLGDGTSISDGGSHPTAVLSLSPNVVLSYDSDTTDSYALTGANEKGAMCYAVMSGDQGVYQQQVAPGADNVVDAADATDYSASADWDGVGQ